jgi:hypothetical protein
VSKAGGAVESVVTGRPIKNVVADPNRVYWSERTSDASTTAPSAIWRAAHGSTVPQLVIPGITVTAFWEEGGSLVVLSQEETQAGDPVASYLSEVGKGGGDCPMCSRIYPHRSIPNESRRWSSIVERSILRLRRPITRNTPSGTPRERAAWL